MNFCSACGSDRVSLRVPDGDNRPRDVCDACGVIHYSNPKVVAGTIPEWRGRILICKRAIEPRRGLWTLPAGFLENHESVEEGALRETEEEADARIDIDALFGCYSIPHISQIYMIYRGALRDLDFGPGPESLEVKLVELDEIPWDDLAFPVIRTALEHYVDDRANGSFRLHSGSIKPMKRDQ
ncbi:MAG: NUDIX hydrolase [Gammaproteobacteria bacterium]